MTFSRPVGVSDTIIFLHKNTQFETLKAEKRGKKKITRNERDL